MKAQPRWELMDRTEVFCVGSALIVVGTVLVVSSFLALGFTGTFLGTDQWPVSHPHEFSTNLRCFRFYFLYLYIFSLKCLHVIFPFWRWWGCVLGHVQPADERVTLPFGQPCSSLCMETLSFAPWICEANVSRICLLSKHVLLRQWLNSAREIRAIVAGYGTLWHVCAAEMVSCLL